jgi:hypothetical protein
MQINIKPSFERLYKKLPNNEKNQIDDKIQKLFEYYASDTVFPDLKIRKLSGWDKYYEIDTSANRRILVRKQKGLIELIAYGNHDDIKRMLKQS